MFEELTIGLLTILVLLLFLGLVLWGRRALRKRRADKARKMDDVEMQLESAVKTLYPQVITTQPEPYDSPFHNMEDLLQEFLAFNQLAAFYGFETDNSALDESAV